MLPRAPGEALPDAPEPAEPGLAEPGLVEPGPAGGGAPGGGPLGGPPGGLPWAWAFNPAADKKEKKTNTILRNRVLMASSIPAVSSNANEAAPKGGTR